MYQFSVGVAHTVCFIFSTLGLFIRLASNTNNVVACFFSPVSNCVYVPRSRRKCFPCKTSVWSESAHCWSARPERSRLLTRSPCDWASATWCSLTWLLILREAGEEEEEARGLRGEATGREEVEEAVTIVITRGAPAHSSPGVTPCWLGAHHPGASTTLVGVVRGVAKEVREGWGTARRLWGGRHQGGGVNRAWAGAPASPLRSPMDPTCHTPKIHTHTQIVLKLISRSEITVHRHASHTYHSTSRTAQYWGWVYLSPAALLSPLLYISVLLAAVCGNPEDLRLIRYPRAIYSSAIVVFLLFFGFFFTAAYTAVCVFVTAVLVSVATIPN